MAGGSLLVSGCQWDRWVHSQVLDCACKHQAPETDEAVSCSFYVYSLFLSVLCSKAWVWWIPTTVYTSNQALILNDRLHGCLCIPMRNWSAACRRLKGCDTLWLTQTCHPASKTTIQHSSARKHDVFYEAGLGSQVFLEATFSERKQVGLCEGEKKKLSEFPPKLFFPR